MSGYFPFFVFDILRLFGAQEEMKYIVGYVFSLIYGYFVTSSVVDGLRNKYGPKREEGCDVLPRITGLLDRFLYTSALITGIPGAGLFIPMWLAVKVARGWRVPSQPENQTRSKNREKDEKEEECVSKYVVGRYNLFLIGNALCVVFGAGGGLIINHWDSILKWFFKLFQLS